MCRLSIVVPFLGDLEPFEDTLVSVLQHRPDLCEVVVVHRGAYEDPYALRGEVEFVAVPHEATTLQALNTAVDAAHGEVLCLLQAGFLALPSCTELAVQRFDDPSVGSVAGLVLDGRDRTRIVSAGIRVTVGGRRVVHGAGAQIQSLSRLLRGDLAGPTLAAAFYRRSAIRAVGGLCEDISEQFADAHLALSLRALGLRCTLEPACQIVGLPEVAPLPSFALGRQAERLFVQHLGIHPGKGAWARHALVVVGSWLRRPHRLGAYTQLLGRLSAWVEPRHRQHRQALSQAPAILAKPILRDDLPVGRRRAA